MKKFFLLFMVVLTLCGCSREKSISSNISKKEVSEEEEIVRSIESMKQSRDENTLKKSFVRLTDFIFYDGEINGKTFQEFQKESKDKILEIYQEMVESIEKKYPGISDEMSHKAKNSYEFLYEKSILLRDKIIQEYQEKVGEDSYQNLVDSYQEGKESIQDVIDEYQPIILDGYESAKDKFSSWYKEYKEG